ncbi:MAG: hypothetical protein ACTSRP_17875 [Candidatus Helarchaeota archaeon]
MIYYAHNPFKVAKQNINFMEYKDEFESFLENYIRLFKDSYPWININEIKTYFWKLVEEADKEHPNNWKVNLCYFLGKILTLTILLYQGRITQQLYDLNLKWFNYLVNRFKPFISNISSDFLGKIYYGTPVMELPQAKSLLKKMVKIFGTSNLIEIFQNSDIDVIDKILAFEENFRIYYSYFLTRCKHIGDELNRLENGDKLRNWGNDLYKIFFLNNDNDKTPPNIVRETLIKLIHIRNAISHNEGGGISHIDEDIVVIIDKNRNGEITFKRTLKVEDLWKFYYELINLDRVLDLFALFIQVCIQLENEKENYVFIFSCSCGNIAQIYIPYNISEFACEKCFKIYKISELKKFKLKNN